MRCLYCVWNWMNEWNWRKGALYVSLHIYKNYIYVYIVVDGYIEYRIEYCICVYSTHIIDVHARTHSHNRTPNVVHSWSLPKLKLWKHQIVYVIMYINAIWHRTMQHTDRKGGERDRVQWKLNSNTDKLPVNLKLEMEFEEKKSKTKMVSCIFPILFWNIRDRQTVIQTEFLLVLYFSSKLILF